MNQIVLQTRPWKTLRILEVKARGETLTNYIKKVFKMKICTNVVTDEQHLASSPSNWQRGRWDQGHTLWWVVLPWKPQWLDHGWVVRCPQAKKWRRGGVCSSYRWKEERVKTLSKISKHHFKTAFHVGFVFCVCFWFIPLVFCDSARPWTCSSFC